ncbi:membrane hypothetical protein [Mesorhizobium metallidurans STM 2683]|uniref:Ceramidase n=1 Tax=Mesorhizobium metallidurans STM 2683 TaxID=1297569 RepID=M5EID0_9HYPH|nr:membrane hypothetical protein [Mesorhizobium metallidurans STM 2683]
MWQTFLTPIDLYCERTGPELWAEPVNALTNLAFIAAGLWGVREVRRLGTGTFAEALAWWVVAIGVGSALFHTFANHGTVWADVLPIAGFTLAYTLFNLRRFLGMGWGKAVVVFVAFYAVAGLLTFAVPDWLRQASNGTTGYLPPFLALAFFGAWVAASGNRAGWYNLAGLGDLRCFGHLQDDRPAGLRQLSARHAFPVAHPQRSDARRAAGGDGAVWKGSRQ